jgi:hypothetical protein
MLHYVSLVQHLGKMILIQLQQISWNEYATKMLLLFFPCQDKVDFPNFEDRWNFFQDCSKSGLLYWDSERLMQNIQDVENSKKNCHNER